MDKSSSETAQMQISAGIQAWIKAVREKDLDGIMSHYADDVVAFDAIDALQFKGVQAYRKHWKACMNMCPGAMTFSTSEMDIQSGEDIAVVHALLNCGMEDEHGNPGPSGYSRMTASYRRIGGRWLVTHEHFSLPFDMQTGRVLCELKPDSAQHTGAVRAIPAGMPTVTPHLICAGAADAIAFYQRAFDAVIESRLEFAPGKIAHACLRIAGSPIFLAEEMPQWGSLGPHTLKGTAVTIHLYVPDADKALDKAVAAGAKAIMPVQEMFWGDRYGMVEDSFGHRWSLATHVRDLTREEIERGCQEMMQQGCPAGAQ